MLQNDEYEVNIDSGVYSDTFLVFQMYANIIGGVQGHVCGTELGWSAMYLIYRYCADVEMVSRHWLVYIHFSNLKVTTCSQSKSIVCKWT